jgi:glutamate synthase (NADPH/NADH) small chain
MPLDVPGAELRGVYQSFPYVSQNALPAGQPAVDVRGKRVAVLGGGDTAMDVLRIAIRRGAAAALCIYRRDEASLPADAEEYEDAREEGAQFMFLSRPVAVLGNAAGEVTHVRCVRMETGDPDPTGRRSVRPAAGSEFDVPADVVFVAYGFTVPRLPDSDDFGKLSLDGRGCLQVDANQMTNFPGVFASGSIVRGPASLSDVVRDARKAAATIDAFLTAKRT